MKRVELNILGRKLAKYDIQARQRGSCLVWYNIEGGAKSHKEKTPSANANLTSDNPHIEEKSPISESRYEEKVPLTTDDDSSLPNNNTSDLNTGLEPKEDIKFTPDYEEKEPIFWRIFEELSNQGNGLVDYYNLQERLLSTGKFYAGDAVLIIEHIEKSGKIEQTGDYHIYRISKPASPNK